MESKKIGSHQELIQSDPISCPHDRSLAGGKITWYFRRSYGLRAGDADLTVFEKIIFFFISVTFCSFWEFAAENKPILWEGMI